MLADIIYKLGEPWCYNHQYDFGLEVADKVADFYNHGGLELYDKATREHTAVSYAAVRDGKVQLGCWVWYTGEDFDEEAEWNVFEEKDFSEDELELIKEKIKKIYGQS